MIVGWRIISKLYQAKQENISKLEQLSGFIMAVKPRYDSDSKSVNTPIKDTTFLLISGRSWGFRFLSRLLFKLVV